MEDVSQIDALLPRFGLTHFRPGQREVIEAVLAGRDCLCVMPTGGGKSLCYQLPALLGEGVTLVVSPLIALMKDQVDSLVELGIRATFINSTLTPDEQSERLAGIAAGEFELVYVVPERFRSSRFLESLRSTKIKLLAIDEAHCISEWGHDFRPDYARLGQFRAQLGQPPTIALTATATAAVRKDIVGLLNLQAPQAIVTGFARPNLFYEIQRTGSQREKDDALIGFLEKTPGAGIVYASSRKRCEEVADTICQRTKRRALAYHAGMVSEDRTRAQDLFMSGKAEIIVATTAFGMGIDKANVRFVVHYNLPGSLEGYYQEAGRAGRDGLPAHCLLLFSPGDRIIHEFFIENAYPARETVQAVYEFLLEVEDDPIEMTQEEVKEAIGLSIGGDGVRACEVLLEKAKVVERLEASQNMAIVRLRSDLPTLVDLLPPQAKTKRRVLRAIERIVGGRRHELIYFQLRNLAQETELESPALMKAIKELKELECFDFVPPFRGRAIRVVRRDLEFDEVPVDFENLEKRKNAEFDRLDRVLNFARSRHCRQWEILQYFGDPAATVCGHCDNCAGASPPRAAAPVAALSAVSPQLVETVRKTLAGVARCQDRFGEGRGLGKTAVAKMLCGSKATEMSKWRLTQLSTYGLLSHLKQEEVAELIDALIGMGHVEQIEVERYRPIARLTESGVAVMQGKQELAGHVPVRADLYLKLNGPASAGSPAPRSAQSTPVPPPPPVPSVKVVSQRPPPAESSSALPSVRESEQGRDLDGGWQEPSENGATPATSTAVPRGSAAVTRLAAAGAPRSGDAALDESARPPYYWTWRLLSSGYTPSECAAIRQLSFEEILQHALEALAAELPVEESWFIPPALAERLHALVDLNEPQPIRHLLQALPRDTGQLQVQWYLKCRAALA
ncbi:MAG TPA: RecQ family ATP-dependent DNA helicase [Pirellulales bacterium]|nr:RecQ family ATP-dependent DNA helicase [Pirellulales bacterium]